MVNRCLSGYEVTGAPKKCVWCCLGWRQDFAWEVSPEESFELSSEGGGGSLLEDQLAKVVGQQGRATQAKDTA